MSNNIRLGCRVELTDKGITGVVAFVGLTQFAKGRWVGINLDEPKGKNNGVVDGVRYFTCDDLHGIFVKSESTFIKILEEPKAVASTQSQIAISSGLMSRSASGSISSGIKPPSVFGSRQNLTSTGLERSHSQLGTAATGPTQLPASPSIPTTNIRPFSRPSLGSISRQNSTLQKQTSHVETLAQQTIVSSTSPSVPASVSNSQSPTNEEVESLRAEVKDLNEKLETLKQKRVEDRNKLKEFEKAKIQLEQLQEFKKQITESHTELNRQLQQAKKEAKEAIEEKLKHADEMKDLAETAEIATLDKEMAEEKYEILSREYEQTKEKLEEVQVEYELLKAEIETNGTEVASNYEVTKLEQQNEKLREAIVKLRELAAQDKYELQKVNKELQSVLEEKLSLEKARAKHSKEIEEYEKQCAELKEQIDFALGAQEMVEILTDRNLQLEDQLNNLKEEMQDMESLHEVNDQLVETMRDTELQLREELDTLTIKLHEQRKRWEEGQESMAEYECTIQKLRDIITKVKKENDILKQQTTDESQNREEEKQKSVQAENLQFKMRFAEAKVFCRAIEMDLRRLEVTQANEYIKYLSLFMPDSFFIRGGDNDAIQVLLFLPRVISKLHIISRQIQEKYPINLELEDQINTTFMFRENETVQQQSFVRKLLYLISALDTLLAQYQDALRNCPLELYLRIASLLPEFSVHEKQVDNYIDLLKRDELDENISLEQLEKTLLYFSQVYTLQLADGKIQDCSKLLNNFSGLMKHAVDSAYFDILVIRSCVRNEADNEQFLHFSWLFQTFGEIRALVKKIKRRLAGETKIRLTSSIENDVRDSVFKINKVASVFSFVRKSSLELSDKARSQSTNDLDLPLIVFSSVEELFASQGGFELLRQHLTTVVSVCSQLTSGLQQGEFDEEISPKQEEQPHSISSLTSLEIKNPLETRAEYLKAQSGQLNELKIKLETKQADLNELRKLLRAKNEEWQEMKIRKERVENKLQKATQEADERVAKLQNELDDLTNTLKRREKETEETMNYLQADIEALEADRTNLRDKLKALSNKTPTNTIESLSVKSPLSPLNQVANTSGIAPALSSMNLHSSIATTTANLTALEASYLEQIRILKLALRRTNDELLDLKAKSYVQSLKPLPKVGTHKPLWLLRAQGKLSQTKIKNEEISSAGESQVNSDVDDESNESNFYVELNQLTQKVSRLEKEATISLIEETRIKPNQSLSMQLQEDRLRNQILGAKYRQLSQEIEVFMNKHLDNQDPIFQDLLKSLVNSTKQSSDRFLAARIKMPSDRPLNVVIDLTLEQLRSIHTKLL